MIFVVLGTQKFQFNRLLKALDKLVEKGLITDMVVAQKGNSDYIPRNYKSIDFMDKEEFQEQIQNCSLMICHSGVGTIISGLKHEKKVIVIPRLAKYKEHIDDHQIEIAKIFEKKGYILVADREDLLYQKIIESKDFIPIKYSSSTHKIERLIEDFIEGEK